MKIQESHIIRLLKKKDKQAIDLLYDQYAGALYNISLKIVHSEDLASDVLQESFVKAWKHGPNYDKTKGTLFTWLLNITRNTAIDKTRSANFRRRGKIQSIDDSVYNLNTQFKTDHIGLRELVDNLEEKYRIIIDLIYFQGFTQKEVEEHLHIPLGSVKSRVRIALRELRKVFEEHNVSLLTIGSQLFLMF